MTKIVQLLICTYCMFKLMKYNDIIFKIQVYRDLILKLYITLVHYKLSPKKNAIKDFMHI